ncbi:oxygenase MpaB family protein [soil metagenome]
MKTPRQRRSAERGSGRPSAKGSEGRPVEGTPATRSDTGLFGPESLSWRVHREAAVMLGGARALLMHAAHPLVVAGARQTQMYTQDPWTRLERTLRLNYLVTFGSKTQAESTARHINQVHERINGVDHVTGLRYDALDPELLLWVHACLVDTALLMERLVVGQLDDAGRQRFHEESMVQAEMLELPRAMIPPTVGKLRTYLDEVMASGILRRTDGSEAVGNLIMNPPPETPQRPLWRLISFWSFGLLPKSIRRHVYSVGWNPLQEAAMRVSLEAVKRLRPLAPAELRLIPPARSAEQRLTRRPMVDESADSLLPGNLRLPPDSPGDSS